MNDASDAAALTLPESAKSFEPGVYDGLPFEDYRAAEAFNAGGAKVLLRSPAHFVYERRNFRSTDAMQFGIAVHYATLQPDEYRERVAYAPECDKRTTKGKSIWSEFCDANQGKLILPAEDFVRAEACGRAIRAHPAARALLEGARTEVTLFWTDGRWKVPCKVRIDVLAHGGIVDLKTTRDASPREFARQAANLFYHLQAAHYVNGHEHVLGGSPEHFTFVAVESAPPHCVACYSLQPADILAGMRLLEIALERYAACRASGRWSGYAETVEALALPAWARRFDPTMID